MLNLINYLDQEINKYYQSKQNYPQKIIMSLEAYNKIISICKEQDLSNSWIEKNEINYKGISIEIQILEGIKLE